MKLWISGLFAIAGFAVAGVLGSAQSFAQNAYITNQFDNTVSVIDTATNTVNATIPVGNTPVGVAVTSNGTLAFVANANPGGSSSVSVIDTVNNMVAGTIPLGNAQGAVGVAVTPDGSKVYVADQGSNGVSVISTATDTVTGIPVGSAPYGVAVSPDGSKVYVTNSGSNSVSVIAAASSKVSAPITGIMDPRGVVVTPDGRTVYVASFGSNSVSVIDTTSNTVTTTVPVGNRPIGVAVTPNGSTVYVTNFGTNPPDGSVSVIATTSNMVTATIPVGSFPWGVAVTPDGKTVYVANDGSSNVSVILTANTVGSCVANTIPVGNDPVAFGIFIASSGVQSAPASGTSCNGVYNGTFNGNIVVSAGQSCEFTGGRVIGNVQVLPGGHFATAAGTTISGKVTITGATSTPPTYNIATNTTIGGDLQITGVPATAASTTATAATTTTAAAPPPDATNSVCGTTVIGSLQFDNNGAAVQIGSADPLVCPGNTIGGDIEAINNTGSVLVFDNFVDGNLRARSNTGTLDVVGNNVGGNLQCLNNSMLIMGGMNTAKTAAGQCN